MSHLSEKSSRSILLGALAFMLPLCALANNGLYLTGYGTESVFMGGADVAVARDAFAANNNPAGLTQLSGQAADVELGFFDWEEASHTDTFGNYRKQSKTNVGGYGNAAYARHDNSSSCAYGVAFVVQGGIGWQYSGLNTAFGTRDDAAATFTIIKLAPAVAWQVNDQLSLGLMLGINYVATEQELFPNTAAFPGFRFKGASGVGLNSKFGLQYKPVEDVTLGVTYGPQTSVPLKNGTLRINTPGQGVVRYDNAKLNGIRLPEELAVGISFRPISTLLVSIQEKYYNWSDAINILEVTATNPRSATAPAVQVISNAANLHDQHVIEFGVAYDYDKDTVLMAGMNFGSSPVDEEHINPIFAPIQARHYMFGASQKLNDGWQVSGGVEVFTLQSSTYNSPLFGPNATERHYGYIFHTALSRRW